MLRTLIAAAVMLMLAGAGAAAPASAYTRTNSGGGVEAAVTYAPPDYFAAANDPQGLRRYEAGRQIVFLVQFTTHAGDLRQFDVVRNSRVRTSREVAAATWISTSDDSHHRAGALVFPQTADGAPVIGQGVTSITLVISNLAGVPSRTFTWALPIR